MVERLVDLYRPGDRVAITFDGEMWHPGVVVKGAHPGVWVELGDGRHWFVTNGRRIRPLVHKEGN